MKEKPIIPPYNLEGICKSIADTAKGLTGSEIGKILADSRIVDISPEMTKWRRLYNAFINHQNNTQNSYQILVFLCQAVHPARYIGQSDTFHQRLTELNKNLSLIGIELVGNGKFRSVQHATTLSEAEFRASNFKQKLEVRNVHNEIFKFCNPELLAENYFHSVFEAVKSIGERLRQMSNVHADGNALVDVAFSISNPLIRVNLLKNDSDRSEHLGLANLIRGLFGIIRNPTAHTPKLLFVIDEAEALDIMMVISFVHKKLDRSL